MKEYYLREETPAEKFCDAYYMGNGSLGFSSMGRVPQEVIYINDDTLWSGSEKFHQNPQHYEQLQKARRAVLEGNVKDANTMINNEMEGRWFETYLPMAELHITIGQKNNRRNMPLKCVIEPEEGEIYSYKRTLDLTRAVSSVCWERDEVSYQQKCFVSYPKQAGFIYIQAEKGKEQRLLNLAFDLGTELSAVNGVQDDTVYVKGIAPDHAEPSYTSVTPSLTYHEKEKSEALRFACCAQVLETNGTVWSDEYRVYVNDADYVWIMVKTGTNYEGFQKKRTLNESAILEKLLKECRALKESKINGQQCMEEHIKDHRSLYDRVDIDLGIEIGRERTTTKRMEFSMDGLDDPSLYALYFQYARYLLIAGSRPGTQPMNLQGLWNDTVMPPWSSNYTNNINVEMNYWLAESGNLSECHLPLMNMILELAESGKQTAKEYYHANGWVLHHNTDLWRSTEPSCEDASWSWWPFGGGWLCEHIWTHYEYTGDKTFLGKMYPVLRGACEFMLEQLVENKDGYLVTAPSISPENKFFTGSNEELNQLVDEMAEGSRCSPNHPQISAVTEGSTMDMSILRELFRNTIEAEKILGMEKTLGSQLEKAMEKFPPYKIGRFGQLLEWYEDYLECSPGMGHISHMYPVYPSSIINWENAPELMNAAKRSLERRILHNRKQSEWPGAWKISLMARMKNSLECGLILKNIGEDMGAGLLTSTSQQIDAILGVGAGIKEMLLQSHQGYIELLPCIPVDWESGSYRGICTEGGFEVSVSWKMGKILEAEIYSKLGGECCVKANGLTGVCGADVQRCEEKNIFYFKTEAGKRYSLMFDKEMQKEYFII